MAHSKVTRPPIFGQSSVAPWKAMQPTFRITVLKDSNTALKKKHPSEHVTLQHVTVCVCACVRLSYTSQPRHTEEVSSVHYYLLRNKNQPDALYFLINSNKYPLHLSNRLTIHHQEAVYCICSLWYLSCRVDLTVLAASQRACMINAIDCMYSKLPAEDE